MLVTNAAREICLAVREPILTPVAIADLRPTRITVGMREVKAKRKRWRDIKDEKGSKFLHSYDSGRSRPQETPLRHRSSSPCARAPRRGSEEGDDYGDFEPQHARERHILVRARQSQPDSDAGRRRDHKDIPKSISELVDDPFRSLAGELRRAGGFAKDTTPFSEFLWADFLRHRIKRKLVDNDFERALETALKLAKGQDAIYLPGWCGPAPEDPT